MKRHWAKARYSASQLSLDFDAESPACSEARKRLEEAETLAWVKRRPKAAIPKCQEAIAQATEAGCTDVAAQAHWQLGQIHFFAKTPDLSAALESFSAATRLAPDWAEAHLWEANTLADLDRPEEAALAYLEAVRRDPADPRIHISLGRCLAEMGRYDDAIAAYREGIRRKPDYGEISARMMLADALMESGDTTGAITEWKSVLRQKGTAEDEEEEQALARTLLAQHRPKISRTRQTV